MTSHNHSFVTNTGRLLCKKNDYALCFSLTEMYICHESSPSFQRNFYNEPQLGFV